MGYPAWRQNPRTRPSGRMIGWMGFAAATLAYVLTHLPGGIFDKAQLPHVSAYAPGSQPAVVGQARIIDGDTIAVAGRRIRLYGIDAPESQQSCQTRDGRDWPCGKAATDALAFEIGANPVRCDPRDIDKYGRTVAVCRIGTTDLNAWMVENGWATAYRYFSLDYAGAEDKAHAAGRGIWAGSFENPYDWRREHPRY